MKIYTKPNKKLISKEQKEFLENLELSKKDTLKKIAKVFKTKVVIKKKGKKFGGAYYSLQNKLVVNNRWGKWYVRKAICHELGHRIQDVLKTQVYPKKKFSKTLRYEQQAEMIGQYIFKKLFPKKKDNNIAYFSKRDIRFLKKHVKKYTKKDDSKKVLRFFKKRG